MANNEPLVDLVARALSSEEPTHDDILRLYIEASHVVPNRTPDSPVQSSFLVRSSFEAGYTDAQNASNGGTSWIGAIGHLCFFDALGGALRRSEVPATAQTDFERALELFSALDERHRTALYALRCALAHDFSLANVPSQSVPEPRATLLRHHFSLWPGGQLDQLIRFSADPWDGNVLQSSDTHVDLGHLADLATRTRDQVLELYAAGDLRLSRPPAEIRRFYFFIHPATLTSTRENSPG